MDAFTTPELAKLPHRFRFSSGTGDFGVVCIHLLRRDTPERPCSIQFPLARACCEMDSLPEPRPRGKRLAPFQGAFPMALIPRPKGPTPQSLRRGRWIC
jgi:hypothetical protein